MMVIQALVLREIYLSFALNEENNTTGIDSVENKKADEENVYYTLSGVRVINPTEKGVYIKMVKKLLYDET